MKAAKTLTALSLLATSNGLSKGARVRKWKEVKERYTRSMNNAISDAKRKLNTDPVGAVKELRKFNEAFYYGPKLHHTGLSRSERLSYERQKAEARRLFEQAKMSRASRKLEILNKKGLKNSSKARTLKNRMSRRFGY